MKLVGYRKPLPASDANSLIDFTADTPKPAKRDLLVAVRAISVNPVDTKVRMRAGPKDGDPPKVLGYDASGIVEAVGPDATLFKKGDEVFYAGSVVRSGTNAEFHLVDERIVGRKPKSLDFAKAAALPLTTITAWEILFDRFGVKRNDTGDKRTLLVMGGAGGVASILIQLARKLTSLTVIATASRPETRDWCMKVGAHHVIDHTKPPADELKATGKSQIDLYAALTHTDQHYPQIVPLMAPQGKIAIIDDPQSIDYKAGRAKSLSIHWESMFTRSMFETADMIAQHNLLNELSKLVDDGTIKTTATQEMSPINAANLRKAHALVESARSIGKLVISGW